MVFFVGFGVLKVCEIYLFILGVNIGICIIVLFVVIVVFGEFVVFVL